MPSTWTKEFNDIIRYHIFANDELKELMMIPDGTNIITFIDRYFIRAGYTSKVLSDENVRIVYSNSSSELGNTPHALRQILSFEIYVKTEHIHNVGTDRLMFRTNLIADKLIEILTKDRIGAFKFYCVGETEMGTSAIGYSRYNVTFMYMRTV